jgi:predicted protein tyrosine phosphatase
MIAERFRVSCLPRAAAVAREWRATHVVSLVDPELPDNLMPVIEAGEHIVARLRDQETLTVTEHFPSIVVSLFNTVCPAVEQNGSRILVHCHAGVSRSTAFIYTLIAHHVGAGREEEAFAAFMSLVNKPWPNRRIVEIMDAHMGCNGALLRPLDTMRRRFPRRIDAWHRFNARRGLPEGSGVYAR